MRGTLLALAAAGAIVITAAVLWQPSSPGTAAPRPGQTGAPPAPPDGRPAVTILAADEYGAILFDRAARAYRGVRRDGSPAWTDPAAARAGASVVCLDRCPDAAISSSAESQRDPARTDPAPYAITGGQHRPFPTPSARKRTVLAADALALGDGEHSWLELRSGGQTRRIAVDGPRTRWSASPDGGHAIAVTTADGATTSAARWFRRTADGWAPEGNPVTVRGTAACPAPGGQDALVYGGPPALLTSGHVRPIAELVNVGACAWSGAGGIVAELALDEHGGRRSRLRAVDRSGSIVWRRDLPAQAAVFADPSDRRVGYVAGTTAHQIDLSTGAEETAEGILAAAYSASGTLVTVTVDGRAHWAPRPR